MLHMHFGDGHDAERPWLPRQDSPIAAATAIHAVLRRTFASIPVFSYDAGVVLEPGVLTPLCIYGSDGTTSRKTLCEARDAGRQCVPGCSLADRRPPKWCESSADEGCGFQHDDGTKEVPPLEWAYGPRSMNLVLQRQSARGDGYAGPGPGVYWGYNEVVVDARAWREASSSAVEAVFVVDCEAGWANMDWRGLPATSCKAAHDAGKALHRAYLEGNGLDADEFPLLMLRLDDWEAPFIQYTEEMDRSG